MGSIYQRRVKFCTRCHRRLDRTEDQESCRASGHAIETRILSTWWIQYRVGGRAHSESSRSKRRAEAVDLLKRREGDAVRGLPVSAKVGQLRLEEAAEDLFNDYRTNGKRSLADVRRRVEKHLKPFFRNRRMTAITTVDVRAFTATRQVANASNGEINRELTALKRMFNLAVQAGKLLFKPYIPMLQEHNVRQGFFEREQYESIRAHLPPSFRGVAAFAFATGWRVPSEILPLEWRQIDFRAAEVRLDPGTTKNDEGRVFPFTTELQRILEEQRRLAVRLREKGLIARYVFFHVVEMKDGTLGKKSGARITGSGFDKAWRRARDQAGCPGLIPHDFRRTAVRNLEQAGVPRSVAMKLTGHKTESVYRRYAIVSSGDLRSAARQLDAYTSAYTQGIARTEANTAAQNS